jgi:hypothetical protein
MKSTNKNINKIFIVKSKNMMIKIFIISVLFINFCNIGFGQNIKDSIIIKTKNNNYKSLKNDHSVYLENTKYEKNIIGRKHYDNEKNDYSFIKLKSHDATLNSFKEAFASERISQLSSKGEKMIIAFCIDEEGNIINLSFLLDNSSSLSTEDIECLENLLIKNVKFEVVGKKINEPIYYRWGFRLTFKEVENGEIEFARKSENFKGH